MASQQHLISKKLGNTGLFVSEICLGAMTLNIAEKSAFDMPTANEAESVNMLNYFTGFNFRGTNNTYPSEECGGNFIDTADAYNNGESERLIGRWMENKRREDFVLATKFRAPTGKSPNDVGCSRKHIMAAVESSLKNLKTDYIDLYQVHSWDPETPIKETFRALNDLVRIGKVRYIGVSNYCGYQLQKSVDLVSHMGLEPIVCLQPQYNLLCRFPEWDLVKICMTEGIGIIPWSPLAGSSSIMHRILTVMIEGGWLTGRYKKDLQVAPHGTRLEFGESKGFKHCSWSYHNNEHTFNVLDAVEKVANETKKTIPQVALRWLCQKPGVTAPIVGASSLQQLKDNIGCVGWQLTAEQMAFLDEASSVNFWMNLLETDTNVGRNSVSIWRMVELQSTETIQMKEDAVRSTFFCTKL